MEYLDGKIIKKQKLEMLKKQLENIKDKLSIAVISVGDNEASNIYLKQKEKIALSLGFTFKNIKLDKNIQEQELISIIESLNNDESITGIMIEMPLPRHLNPKIIQNKINYKKDIDGLTTYNAGLLFHNENEVLIPATAKAVIDILDYYNIDIDGKNAVIVGRSDVIGKPVFTLLLNRNASVSICHSKTINLKSYTKMADILVVAIGKPNFIKEEHIKEGAIVIDVGINIVNDKIVGDVDFNSVKDKVSYITPVPGGVGQLTVINLAENTYKAYTLKKNNERRY